MANTNNVCTTVRNICYTDSIAESLQCQQIEDPQKDGKCKNTQITCHDDEKNTICVPETSFVTLSPTQVGTYPLKKPENGSRNSSLYETW